MIRKLICLLFFSITSSSFSESKPKRIQFMGSFSLGLSFFRNDLNDSTNSTFNQSILYSNILSYQTIKPENILYHTKKEDLEKSNQSQGFSNIPNDKTSFDFFFFKTYSIGYISGSSHSKVSQISEGSIFGNGGYSLILRTMLQEKFPTIPFQTETKNRRFNYYLFSAGKIFQFKETIFQLRLISGIARIQTSSGTPGVNAPTFGFSLGLTWKVRDQIKDEVLNRSEYLVLEFFTLKYFIPGDFQNQFTQRLDSNKYLSIIEFEVNFGYKVAIYQE